MSRRQMEVKKSLLDHWTEKCGDMKDKHAIRCVGLKNGRRTK